jgi:hypothetical protein
VTPPNLTQTLLQNNWDGIIYRAGDQVPVVIEGKQVGQIAVSAIFGEPKPKSS